MEFLGIPSENLLNRVILIQRITRANNNWIKVTGIQKFVANAFALVPKAMCARLLSPI